MQPWKINFDSLAWASPAPGIRFKAFTYAGQKLRLLEFSKGFIEPDWCLKAHIGLVLEGTMDLDFNGTIVHFSKGDGIFIPGGEKSKHKAKVREFVRLVLVEDAD
jgi:hypothetical protein